MTSLLDTEQHWDNKNCEYNLQTYNWPAWTLKVIQEIAPEVTELEKLHTFLDPAGIVKVTQHVQNACSRQEFMTMFDQFANDIVPQRIDNKQYLVQRQGTLRVVVPNQSSYHRRLPFHNDFFAGNGRGLRTIWIPLTKSYYTNTMWMVDLPTSRRLAKQLVQEKWKLERFEKECMKYAFPVNLNPGQCHLFLQEHLHGNVNNEENYTRVSLDMRIMVRGEEYGRKTPGGYLRLPGDYGTPNKDYSGKTFLTYASWNSEFSRHIPLPMQRSIIERYCSSNNIRYNEYAADFDHLDYQPALEQCIQHKPDGIVLTSMFSLTDDKTRRDELLDLALDLGVQLHFANECCALCNHSDLDKIQTYLNFGLVKSRPYEWE